MQNISKSVVQRAFRRAKTSCQVNRIHRLCQSVVISTDKGLKGIFAVRLKN